MKVKNKWNSNIYTVLSISDGTVKLQRSDGSEFTITQKEFKFNYVEVHYDKKQS